MKEMNFTLNGVEKFARGILEKKIRHKFKIFANAVFFPKVYQKV